VRTRFAPAAFLAAIAVLTILGLLVWIAALDGGGTSHDDASPSGAPATVPVAEAASGGSDAPAAGVSPADLLRAAALQPATNHEEYVEQRSAQLMELAMNDDQGSLNAILSEMTNSDSALRKAALRAAVEFDDRGVIPRLRQIASETEDPGEKKAILDAVNYLSLPTLTEYLQQHPANSRMVAASKERRLLPAKPGSPVNSPPTVTPSGDAGRQ
jgi:hypothetical protein